MRPGRPVSSPHPPERTGFLTTLEVEGPRPSPRLDWTPEWQVPEFSTPVLTLPRIRSAPDFELPKGTVSNIPSALPPENSLRNSELPDWEFRPRFPDLELSSDGLGLDYHLDFDELRKSLEFRVEGSRLRPRSPYCMPGHSSQNFVVYSVHDGLPLHPGVW